MDEALWTYSSWLHHSLVKVLCLFRWAEIAGRGSFNWNLLHLVQLGSFVYLSWHLAPDISFLPLWWWQSKGLYCLHWWLIRASLFRGTDMTAFSLWGTRSIWLCFVLLYHSTVMTMIYTILICALNLNIRADNSWSHHEVCILRPIGWILTTIAIVLASINHVIANLYSVVCPILGGKLDIVVDLMYASCTVIQTALCTCSVAHA